jgi:hypothetical protein
MRTFAGLAVLAATCALGAASASSAGRAADNGAPVYAVTGGAGEASISRRNPRTLEQLGPAVPLGEWDFVAGLSPDGTLLAAVATNSSPASIRFLDVTRMRWRGAAVPLPTLGTGAVRWADPRTVLVLGERPDGLRAVVVDSDRGRIVRKVRIPGHLEGVHARPTAAGLALLVRPLSYRPMGPVRVGVIRPSGKVRVAEIKRVQLGGMERSRRPALVADPAASTAYVFGGLDEPVAEVDLRTMKVTYHRLRGIAPLEGTLGADRFGMWLGSGRIALGGWDEAKAKTRRLGVSLVSTRTWGLRRLDRDADFFVKSGDLLLSLQLDGSLGVFGPDGSRRLSVGEQAFQLGYVASNGRFVYAYNLPPGAKASALVVDTDTGAASWSQAPSLGPVLSPGMEAVGT